MKNTLDPNTNNSKVNNVLQTILGSAFKLLVIGGIVTIVAVAISVPKSKFSNLQKPGKQKLISAEQKTKNKPVISPYTVVLNQGKNSVTLILNNGVKINVENLNNKQEKCIIFGGGLGCIDSLYNPKNAVTKVDKTKAVRYKSRLSFIEYSFR
ncbi:MAG: hypothetical protein F6K22_07955 [Okeania sp. SIO2F4]|uniref:hypothetical protein n=1 Tax=Okeania sp. SIO2F4 TaxID=2607790 RepID=UPI00142B17B5|nr:hypothetical protein [Okeania sp. SIO2F4]NES02785.1 hypothetical protein [Okeania sp. SIO2F4]